MTHFLNLVPLMIKTRFNISLVFLVFIIWSLTRQYALSQTSLWPHGIGVQVDAAITAIHILDTIGIDHDLILESNNDQFLGSALLSLWRNSPNGMEEPVSSWHELGFMRFYIPLLGSFEQVAGLGASGRVESPMDRGRGSLYFMTSMDGSLDRVLTLDSNSNAGLRTSTVRYDLDLACDNIRPGSSANIWGGLNLHNPGSGGNWTFFPTKYSDPFITQDRLTLYLNNTLVGFFRADGSWFAASDRSLKKSIQPITKKQTDKLLKLKPKRYQLKQIAGNKTEVGFIAQRLEKQYPDLVQKQAKTPHKAINYYGLLPYLIRGIQEVDQLNDEIDKQLDALLSNIDNSKH